MKFPYRVLEYAVGREDGSWYASCAEIRHTVVGLSEAEVREVARSGARFALGTDKVVCQFKNEPPLVPWEDKNE